MTLVRLEPFATPHLTHANGLRSGGLVVVAGQVGLDENGSAPPDLAEQTRLAAVTGVAGVVFWASPIGSISRPDRMSQ